MKTEKTTSCLLKTTSCLLVFIFIATSVLYAGILPQEKSEKVMEKNEKKSLIKKELLALRKKSLAPPKRNIFTRQRAGTSMVGNEFSPSGDFQSPGQASGQKISPEQKKAAMEKSRINAIYIGYVRSGKRVVALIILEGQTYAVESGDVLETGVTIGEITPDDLEIMSQGSEPQRISLEGE